MRPRRPLTHLAVIVPFCYQSLRPRTPGLGSEMPVGTCKTVVVVGVVKRKRVRRDVIRRARWQLEGPDLTRRDYQDAARRVPFRIVDGNVSPVFASKG